MWYERKQRCNEGSRKRMAKMNAEKRADEKKGKAKKDREDKRTRREYDKKKLMKLRGSKNIVLRKVRQRWPRLARKDKENSMRL